MGIFHIGKRMGYFVHWEPIYIGTHADPHYDERLSWEGKSDKMTQVKIKLISFLAKLRPLFPTGIRIMCIGLRIPHPGQCIPRAQARH